MVLFTNAQIAQNAGCTADFHGQMNSANIETWVVGKLVTNLPHHAVIVLDNLSCH